MPRGEKFSIRSPGLDAERQLLLHVHRSLVYREREQRVEKEAPSRCHLGSIIEPTSISQQSFSRELPHQQPLGTGAVPERGPGPHSDGMRHPSLYGAVTSPHPLRVTSKEPTLSETIVLTSFLKPALSQQERNDLSLIFF